VLTTLVRVLAAIALLRPGFVIAELAKSGRARARESDLELALRALFYALILHGVFVWWTRNLVLRIDRVQEWTDHVDALLLYTAVVLVAAPTIIGIGLNLYLRHVEAGEGTLKLRHQILGGRDARDAWDYLFQRLNKGAWLIVELRGGDPESPRLLGGKYGDDSAVGQSPTEHNLYLEELWTVSTTFPRNLVEAITPQRGIWVAADEIESIQVLNPPGAEIQSETDGEDTESQLERAHQDH
jgi:hypothetical protein